MSHRIISWDEYFMGVAKLSGLRSKDPNTQVGCCIVNQNKKIVAVGYNGMPMGCNDKDFPWDVKEGSLENTKYAYVCHSELNAILNSKIPVNGCKLYVTLFPCNECAKVIIQSGIKEVVYMCDKYADTDSVKASKRMLNSAGIIYRQYTPTNKEINIKL